MGTPDSAEYLSPKILDSANPWQVLAAILVRAQRGDFSELGRIKGLMKSYDEYLFWTACTELISNAAPVAVLDDFIDELWRDKTDPGTQTFLSIALSNTGRLSAVERLLELHALAEEEDPRYEIERNLSYMLEPGNGVLWDGAEETTVVIDGATDDDDPEIRTQIDTNAYAQDVRQQCEKVIQNLGAADACVFEGMLIDVVATANRLVANLNAQSIAKGRMIRERMFIEATTGISFAQAHDKLGNLMFLPALALLETFLESDEAAGFRPGIRYFFGHEIPGQ